MLPDHYTIPLVPGDFNQIERPRGMLFVTVVSSVNVPKMDWFNGSDPYVRYVLLLAMSNLASVLSFLIEFKDKLVEFTEGGTLDFKAVAPQTATVVCFVDSTFDQCMILI